MNITLLNNNSIFLEIKENLLNINYINNFDKIISISRKQTLETYRIIQPILNIQSSNMESITINS